MKSFFISLFSLCLVLRSYGQSDSLTVFFKIAGPKHERFNIYYQGKNILSSPKGGLFLGSFKILTNKAWGQKTRLDFYATKSQLFGLFSKYISIGVFYNPKQKYLVFERDPGRKNNTPIISYWSDTKPYIIQ